MIMIVVKDRCDFNHKVHGVSHFTQLSQRYNPIMKIIAGKYLNICNSKNLLRTLIIPESNNKKINDRNHCQSPQV